MNTKKRNSIIFLKYCFISILLLRLVLVFWYSLLAVQQDSRSDLRNRIVGTRIALLGKDPYFYIEPANGDERLIDPHNFVDASQSRLSVTPSILLLHSAYVWIDYSKIIVFWFFVQWVLYFMSMHLAIKNVDGEIRKSLIIFAFLIFGNSKYWISNLINLQVYVVYLFLVSLAYYFLKHKREKYTLITTGVLTALRPPYLILSSLLLTIKGFRKNSKYFVISLLVILTISFLAFNPLVWNQYVNGMIMSTSSALPMINNGQYNPQASYPPIIDGLRVSQDSVGYSPENEFSLRTFIFEWKEYVIPYTVLIFCILIINFFGLAISSRKKNITANEVFFLGLLLTIVAEYFLPSRRYLYANIQWLMIIVIIISDLNAQKLVQSLMINGGSFLNRFRKINKI